MHQLAHDVSITSLAPVLSNALLRKFTLSHLWSCYTYVQLYMCLTVTLCYVTQIDSLAYRCGTIIDQHIGSSQAAQFSQYDNSRCCYDCWLPLLQESKGCAQGERGALSRSRPRIRSRRTCQSKGDNRSNNSTSGKFNEP